MKSSVITVPRPVEVLQILPNGGDNYTTGKNEIKHLRVAAYCRVSTDLEMQEDSFELQEAHYTRLITSTSGWQLAGIYSDKGVSGTAVKQRSGFMRMLRQCEAGKIDKIICKSVSRFARNTITTLDTVRRLKDMKISVYFEKENLDTSFAQSELILTMIAAIAQDESRTISENMAWSFKKRFQQGIPVFRRMMGYEVEGRGADREIRIVESEAKTVREIYSMALGGTGYKTIAEILMRNGIKTVDGKDEWTTDRIKGILRNEKYTGTVICQKTYTPSYLSHQKVVNTGQRPQYIVENHHPAIIDQATYDAVQRRFEKNKRTNTRNGISYPLSGRILCGDCGSTYHRMSTRGNTRWGCSRRLKSKRLCNAGTITEAKLEIVMLEALKERYCDQGKGVADRMRQDLVQAMSPDFFETKLVRMKRDLAQHKITEAEEESNSKPGTQQKMMENKLEDYERSWSLFDKDRDYREKALKWLEDQPHTEAVLKELNIALLRAWVMQVTILSPMLFDILWLDNTRTTVDMADQTKGVERQHD